jgi:hypothetical protein
LKYHDPIPFSVLVYVLTNFLVNLCLCAGYVIIMGSKIKMSEICIDISDVETDQELVMNTCARKYLY